MRSFVCSCSVLLLTTLLMVASHDALAVTKNMCVFDLLGANGPVFAQMKDYKIAALDWGVELRLKPYTSERAAAEDFKSGVCDAVSITGVQSRQFNSFSGSLDAIGALPTYEHLKSVITTISSKQAATLMVNGAYEVVGIIPMGAVYLFVNDRSIVMVGEVAGIRVAIMGSDPAQSEMVAFIGASPVSLSITDMYSKFNNRSVDVTYGPAVVYEAMELHQGMLPGGGVIRFPMAQSTLQLLIRKAVFPEQFGQKSRDYALNQFDKAVKLARNYESRISESWWISIPDSDQARYNKMFRQVRLKLREKGVYNRKILSVMRMDRCKKDPLRPECSVIEKE